MKIKVESIKYQQEFESWDVWECEVSEFDWEYSDQESCYIINGKAEISYQNEKVIIKEGDFVVFPKSLKCKWKVLSPIKKYYSFGEFA